MVMSLKKKDLEREDWLSGLWWPGLLECCISALWVMMGEGKGRFAQIDPWDLEGCK